MSGTLHKRLFKLNSDGKSIQVWEIYRSFDAKSYWTVSGKRGCKMTVSAPTAVVAKVSRTQHEQVLQEMDSKVNVQRRRRYVDDILQVEAAGEKLPGYTAMLAKKFKDESKHIVYPCVIQPKLDGVRCLATKDGFFTRGRKPIEACAHIRHELVPFFQQNPDARLDGELYAHEFKDDFETIIKAVRKTASKATPQDIELQHRVQYHIYDVPRFHGLKETDPFIARFVALGVHGGLEKVSSVRLVETRFEVLNEEMLKQLHGEFIFQGYEGSIVRDTYMWYEGKRSRSLLKMKEFDEDEFIIENIKEGRGALVGHAGAFILRTKEGNEFRGKLEGSVERLGYIFQHPESVIGKAATVRYYGLTNRENVPRFPVVKSVRGLLDGTDWL